MDEEDAYPEPAFTESSKHLVPPPGKRFVGMTGPTVVEGGRGSGGEKNLQPFEGRVALGRV